MSDELIKRLIDLRASVVKLADEIDSLGANSLDADADCIDALAISIAKHIQRIRSRTAKPNEQPLRIESVNKPTINTSFESPVQTPPWVKDHHQ